MDFQHQRGVAIDRASVVADACLVGRADFAQARAARLENLWNAKAAADLQQLAARDDDLGRSVRRALV